MSGVWQGYVRLQAGEGRRFRVAPGGKAVVADGEGINRLPEGGEVVLEAQEDWEVPVSVYPDPSCLEWSADGASWSPVPEERLRRAGNGS